jgi:hypothetical protein
MLRKVEPETALTLFLVTGVAGVFVVIACFVLIVLSPSMLGPYFSGFGGLCVIVVGFGSRRAIKNASQPKK